MKTEAARGVGVDELVAEFDLHKTWLLDTGVINRFLAEKNSTVFADMLKERLFAEVHSRLVQSGELGTIVEGMGTRAVDPYSAVEKVLYGISLVEQPQSR